MTPIILTFPNDGLRWDEAERLDHWICRHFNSASNPLELHVYSKRVSQSVHVRFRLLWGCMYKIIEPDEDYYEDEDCCGGSPYIDGLVDDDDFISGEIDLYCECCELPHAINALLFAEFDGAKRIDIWVRCQIYRENPSYSCAERNRLKRLFWSSSNRGQREAQRHPQDNPAYAAKYVSPSPRDRY